MRLTDIMSNAGLSFYAQVALVIFLLVFIAITLRTFAPSRRRELDAASRLPFDEGVPVSSANGDRGGR
jgi:cbb3-type cytochrome oxidase subunit 3